MKMITAAVLFACATHANAWDGQTTGPIEQIEVGTVVADGIAVYQSGVRVMCNKGPEYAVLGENDKNAKAISAILMSAKMIGEPVVLYTNNVGGMCRIGGIKIGGPGHAVR